MRTKFDTESSRMRPVPDIVVLGGHVQNYAWGSTSLLPNFLGTTPDGRPQAELWLGAHPVLPSTIVGMSLERAVGDFPREFLGPYAPSDADSLPFLLKVMAVESPLSIQVHPSKAQAEAGFLAEERAGIAREAGNRNFRDSNHKPEIICALSEFSLLCGFVDDAQTQTRLTAIREAASRAGSDKARAALATIAEPNGPPEQRRDMLRAILSIPADAMPEIIAAIRRSADGLGLIHLHGIADHYPTDPGVLVAALMNYRALQPGEAMFFAAGTTHAYLHGLGIELLANSDNVVRAGLTPKHIDIEQLLRICDPSPSTAALVNPMRSSDVTTWPTPCTDFELGRVEPGPTRAARGGFDSGPRIVLCTSGSVLLGNGSSESDRDHATLTLDKGMAAWVFPGIDLRIARSEADVASSVYIARCPQLGS